MTMREEGPLFFGGAQSSFHSQILPENLVRLSRPSGLVKYATSQLMGIERFGQKDFIPK